MPDKFDLSRRKTLAAIGTIGVASAGAGLGTSAFFSEQETSENNRLTAGKLDLKVGWTVKYFDWIGATPQTISEVELTDKPGPNVQLMDVKPGDVITHSLTAHIFGNPGFLWLRCVLEGDADDGTTEPEDAVNGPAPDGADGTPGGDLGEALRMVAWFDDGDGLPQEIWAGDFPETEKEFVMAVGDAERPSDIFDLQSPNIGAAGTAFEVCHEPRLLDPRVNGHVANGFPDSLCYQNSKTETLGILVWVPNDIPDLNDNIIQTDRCEYSIRFDAIQCRHNISDDGTPRNRLDDGLKMMWYDIPDEPKTANIQFTSQLERIKTADGEKKNRFVDIGLRDIVALLEPATKSDNENSAPAEAPDSLGLTVYDIKDDALEAPPIDSIKVVDQFSDPFELKIGAPKWFCDRIQEKHIIGEEPQTGPFLQTPAIIYKIEKVVKGTPGEDTVATRDQFTSPTDLQIGQPTHLIEPALKKKDGQIFGGDGVDPLLLRDISPEAEVNISLNVRDQFIDLGIRAEDSMVRKRFAENVKKKTLEGPPQVQEAPQNLRIE